MRSNAPGRCASTAATSAASSNSDSPASVNVISVRQAAGAKVTRAAERALRLRPGEHQLLHLVRRRKRAARAERAAVQRRDSVRIPEDILEILVRPAEASGGKCAAKDVPGAGAVDARHLKRGRADLAPVAPREAAFASERHAHERRAE